MKKLISLACACMLLAASLPAQVKTEKRNNLVWFGDFSKLKLNEHWSVYFDFGLRRTEWLSKWSQVLIRPGITYSFNENVSFTAGLAYFDHYSAGIVRQEFRGWEQLLFSERIGRLKITHRLRAEQRTNQYVENGLLTETYKYNNRYRYQLGIQLPLNHATLENKTVYLTVSDEAMLNSGHGIVYNYFDQNRAAAGIGFKFNELLNISVSYMNDYIQKNQPGAFENNNVIVLNLYHNFKVKK
jgi:hypothetical protein